MNISLSEGDTGIFTKKHGTVSEADTGSLKSPVPISETVPLLSLNISRPFGNRSLEGQIEGRPGTEYQLIIVCHIL